MSASADIPKAWAVTQDLSVRTRIRTYRPDGRGGWLNATRNTPIGRRPPRSPWAVYLADEHGRYHTLCFDFDAHHSQEETVQAERDASECAALLERHGIGVLTCVSGPSGGRHVWAASLDGLDAALVSSIAMGMKTMLPTLDPTPLLNPRTGCARPPYSPHRLGGASTPVKGDIDRLLLPDSHEEQWEALERTIAMESAARANTTRRADLRPSREGNVACDRYGHPWIPGRRRNPSRAILTLIDTPCQPGEDRSARMWRILTACAIAHWALADVLALADKPGMAHARTRRDPNGIEHPRPLQGAGGTLTVICDDWRRAVTAAMRMRRDRGDDPQWPAQADRTNTIATGVLHAAMSRPERFTRGGGPADLRVLAALCLYAVQACTDTIQADIRRLGIDTGIGRETARCALKRLERDGWIRLSDHAQGREADTWKIGGTATKGELSRHARSQMNMPPARQRDRLIRRIGQWLIICSHDAFAGQPEWLHAGNQYATHILQAHAGSTAPRIPLQALDGQAWLRGTLGRNQARRNLYEMERLVWNWWLSELDWMKAPATLHHRRETTILPDTLKGRFPAMPRGHRNRVDWTGARRQASSWLPAA